MLTACLLASGEECDQEGQDVFPQGRRVQRPVFVARVHARAGHGAGGPAAAAGAGQQSQRRQQEVVRGQLGVSVRRAEVDIR